MAGQRAYPRYRTYQDSGRQPSLLAQSFPRPTFDADEIYYPEDELLRDRFSSTEESRKFGAAMFTGFLDDTIEVEHNLVIPAVSALRRLPFYIPARAEQDLYATATDEGFHAEQSLKFTDELRSHFGLQRSEQYRTPLFLRRLEHQRSLEPNELYRHLVTVLNGVVTETRISLELGDFARNSALAESVREVCRTHAEDEAIHASQFRALGEWLWGEFDENTRAAAAKFLIDSSIARSMPDVDRIAFFFHQATGRPLANAQCIIYTAYTEDASIDRLLFAARPTVTFIQKLGVEQYVSFSEAIEQERRSLSDELVKRREALHR